MIKNIDLKDMKIIGPLLVCLGAFFWATDFPVRSQLVATFGGTVPDAIQLAMFEHLLAILIFVIIIIAYSLYPNKKEKIDFKKFLELNKMEFFSLLFIGICGSALGIIFFNLAFGQAAILSSMHIYSGYDQTLFVQKIQPIIAIALAAILIKERLPKGFFVLAGIALMGIFFVTFGTNTYPFFSLSLTNASQLIILYALAASVCWGASTVFGRIVVLKLGHTMTTLGRYVVGGSFLVVLNIVIGTNFIEALTKAIAAFAFLLYAAAISGGLLGLYIYYYGLKWTKASVATLCELTYPIAGVVLNYFFLNQSMMLFQWVGGLILVISITAIAYINAIAPETDLEKSYLESSGQNPWLCEICGSKNKATKDYCNHCGASLKASKLSNPALN